MTAPTNHSTADTGYLCSVSELSERLGFSANTRLVLLSADLLGSSHASTEGAYAAVRSGLATGATLSIPGPWSRYAASQYRGEDVGVLLTLNAELDTLRWGPITHAPSLLDGEGGFPRTLEDLWDHADLEEVRRECRAQVERAILWGFRLTHLATLRSALQQRPEFFDILLDLGCEYRLPIRLHGVEREAEVGFPFRQLAVEEGVVIPDRVIHASGVARTDFEKLLSGLEPGITEIIFEPATDSAELRAADPRWSSRVSDLDLLVGDSGIAATIERALIEPVSYKSLCMLQRRS